MNEREQEKLAAARRSLEYVEDGMLLGLGTGSSAAHAIRLIGERVRGGLRCKGVPTSKATRALAEKEGIPLVGLDLAPRLDLTIDGADEIDPLLRLIKGGGGALFHEKIVAAASDRVVIIADATKETAALGGVPLPVEVIPFALPVVTRRLEALGMNPSLRGGATPFVTDEGNRILDCRFGPIAEPDRLAALLQSIPGVVAHGLFIGLAHVVIIGSGESTRLLTR